MKYRLLALDLDGTAKLPQGGNARGQTGAPVGQGTAYVVLSTGRIVGEAAEFARELP